MGGEVVGHFDLSARVFCLLARERELACWGTGLLLWLELLNDLHGVAVLVLGADDNQAVNPDALDILIDNWCAIDILRFSQVAYTEFDQFVLPARDVGCGEGDGFRSGGVVPAGHGIALGLTSRLKLTAHREVELEDPRRET